MCGLLKQGKICVLFRICAQREEDRNCLFRITRAWKLNQPDVPSNSMERKKSELYRDFA